ncbi:MAG: tRNA lysidine(34) synthetase TilS [Oscillospiraceae bacterium]|nr:tRNA lysidine(34) synthetase TilS [Oscillospiraceae bacterium]
MTGDLTAKAEALICRYTLLEPGDRVLAAVSGGADSLALLALLWENRDRWQLAEVAAAHLNHQLRGAESDADAALTAAYCADKGIRLYCESADVAALAAAEKTGIEAAGRAARYAFFERIAEERGYTKIATAHTLSDNIETVLLHIARGSGLCGLCGIPPARDKIIRPLLEVTRAEVEAYCAANHITYAVDSTNADLVFARNRLRKAAVPALFSVNPAAGEAIARMTAGLRADEQYLAEQAARVLEQCCLDGGYNAPELARMPEPIRRRALRLAAAENGGYMEAIHTEAAERLLARLRGSCALPGGMTAAVERGVLTFRRTAKDQMADSIDPLPVNPDGPGNPVKFGAWTVNIGWVNAEEFDKMENYQNIHKNILKAVCDYDKIWDNMLLELYLRVRRPGDKFCPAGRKVTKRLKQLFSEAKTPLRNRGLPLLCDKKGILMVPGFGCDQRVATDKHTRRYLIMTVHYA